VTAASQSTPKPKPPLCRIVEGLFVIFIMMVLIGVALGPGGGGGMPPSYGKGCRAMKQSQAIYELIIAYAKAHQGAYPTGESSTEIFQKLIDENHMTSSGKTFKELSQKLSFDQVEKDTAIFWLDLPGKIMATSTVLKPENVCFDVTTPIDEKSPDKLPAVFMTGYRVSYVPKGVAVPLAKSGVPDWAAVSYKDGYGWGISLRFPESDWPYFLPDGGIANFIPPTFDPAGKKYQQLTPDGPLR
jgi:hypothetical protein